MLSPNLIKLIKIAAVFAIAAVLLALTGCIGAGMYPQFTYQGRLTNENGLPINGDVKITYRIYNQSSGGSALYSETENVNVDNGNFSSVIGPSGVAGGLTPDDIAQPLWVELQIGNGTYTETLTPRQRLYGAPYAFTLMPGTVISNSFGSAFTNAGIEGIVTIKNKYDGDASDLAAPALKVEGETGIELTGLGSNDVGTIVSDIDESTSELYIRSNYDIELFLDDDSNNSAEWFRIAKNANGGAGTTLCTVDVSGDLDCIGSKSAVLELDGEQRLMYAIESSEVWLEDFGSAALENGEAWITIDPLFADGVNLNEEYHVFVTPLGDCNGLYIAEKTATGFRVKELGGGNSSISFDYRITAKRVGYENERMELAPGFIDREEKER
jgi:hypothetical protein